jgi:hypothetical protein
MAELFDPPDPLECYRRTRTVVPQQALALTNGKLSDDQSRALARRLAEHFPFRAPEDESAFIRGAYEQVLTRRPTPSELATCRDFLKRELEINTASGNIETASGASTTTASSISPGAASPILQARTRLVHALFNHHDFVTIH